MNWYLIIGIVLFILVIAIFVIVDHKKRDKGLTIYHSDEFWLRVLFSFPAAASLFKSCFMAGWWPVIYHSVIIGIFLASWFWLLFDAISNKVNKQAVLSDGSGGAKNNSESDKILRSIGEIPAILLKVLLVTVSTILFYYMQKGRL